MLTLPEVFPLRSFIRSGSSIGKAARRFPALILVNVALTRVLLLPYDGMVTSKFANPPPFSTSFPFSNLKPSVDTIRSDVTLPSCRPRRATTPIDALPFTSGSNRSPVSFPSKARLPPISACISSSCLSSAGNAPVTRISFVISEASVEVRLTARSELSAARSNCPVAVSLLLSVLRFASFIRNSPLVAATSIRPLIGSSSF